MKLYSEVYYILRDTILNLLTVCGCACLIGRLSTSNRTVESHAADFLSDAVADH